MNPREELLRSIMSWTETRPTSVAIIRSVRKHVRYFSQKTGRRTAVSLCTYGDRPGIDRCTYGVRTGVVCTYAVSFSLADAFAIGLWLLSFRLKTKFATLRS